MFYSSNVRSSVEFTENQATSDTANYHIHQFHLHSRGIADIPPERTRRAASSLSRLERWLLTMCILSLLFANTFCSRWRLGGQTEVALMAATTSLAVTGNGGRKRSNELRFSSTRASTSDAVPEVSSEGELENKTSRIFKYYNVIKILQVQQRQKDIPDQEGILEQPLEPRLRQERSAHFWAILLPLNIYTTSR